LYLLSVLQFALFLIATFVYHLDLCKRSSGVGSTVRWPGASWH
jgi:hypothetical protein